MLPNMALASGARIAWRIAIRVMSATMLSARLLKSSLPLTTIEVSASSIPWKAMMVASSAPRAALVASST